MKERPPLARPVAEAAGDAMLIDAATRRNLEIAETLTGTRDGSLLAAIDRTRHRRRRAAPGPPASPALRPTWR